MRDREVVGLIMTTPSLSRVLHFFLVRRYHLLHHVSLSVTPLFLCRLKNDLSEGVENDASARPPYQIRHYVT